MSKKRKLTNGQLSPSSNNAAKKQRRSQQKQKTGSNLSASGSSNTRCRYCKQFLDDAVQFRNERPDAQEECVALTHPALSLVSEGSVLSDEADARPQQKLTDFSVYCPAGHLCPFDTGLIEDNVELYFSGLLVPVYAAVEDEEAAGSTMVACCRMGPIDEWWLSGFDGGQRAIVGFSTVYGEYILAKPHSEYRFLMESALEKIHLTKRVTECLLDDSRKEEAVEYEELLELVAPISADAVQSHASFLIEQVRAMDDEEGTELMRQPCMQTLVELGGLNEDADSEEADQENVDRPTGRRDRRSRAPERRPQPRRHRRIVQAKPQQAAQSADTKATVTPLVRSVFDSIFQHQLDDDAGAADFVTSTKADMFLRLARLNAAALVQAGDPVEFLGEPIQRRPPSVAAGRRLRLYYSAVRLGSRCRLSIGDFVLWRSSWRDARPGSWRAARITRLYSEGSGPQLQARFHGSAFLHGEDTILGRTADPCELFATNDECCSAELAAVVMRLEVARRSAGDRLVTASAAEMEANASAGRLFYQKVYLPDKGFFIDPPNDQAEEEPADPDADADGNQDDEDSYRDCSTCSARRRSCLEAVPRPCRALTAAASAASTAGANKQRYSAFRWRGQVYKLLGCCYLEPGSHKFANESTRRASQQQQQQPAKADKDSPYPDSVYTERYRKTAYVKGSNESTPAPYQIGRIVEIFKRGPSFPLRIRLKMFYRPEDAVATLDSDRLRPLHLLYCSDEECSVVVSERVRGLCTVVHADELEGLYTSPEQFFLSGPDRFYYDTQFDADTGQMESVCVEQESVDLQAMRDEAAQLAQVKPLRCLDVFSGCGGLSEGLHQAGAAVTHWAIERDPDAAKAFALNHPDCAVLTDDCNRLLRLAMDGVSETPDSRRLPIPQRGQVQLLCGGPPCQGYSGMNRFSAREASKLKNSLVASFLSYADFYRPDYFLLENVRNFAAYNKSCVLQLTMRCLLAMGYQLGAAILQAGQFGVPQTRRRLIILAAAPGRQFAQFPIAVHSFSPKACAGLALLVGDRRYEPPTSPASGCFSGPLRPITVGDALSDLPVIDSGGASRLDQPAPYGSKPKTHYQLIMRAGRLDNSDKLTDHVTKQLTPLVEARLALIPTCPGADWRDLPNVEITLSDGSLARRLRYTHGDRGVCPCAIKPGKCDSQAKQLNTLIPWCLPHTGDRHNHWAGLYGRLDVEGFFSTTVTNPEPMGKQGRVVHPTQNRVVSVRECARSQGFPDAYRFAGDLVARHRQIGNAVPPPLARALGVQLVRALAAAVQDSPT
ncbi:hypothetical protein BOX15_Mlig007124g1 [Macrostomum lignano]|uniref:DNA (cytosine-5-)-methyltransferase n=2 Tax=Macrostomum lignano TaxID=282301 RepID=A0A267FPM9_9PLAT|nr:hypothetical protein BOX15_Mlig009036g1 [Macrostomum lignano]PAA90354.1 hypothetical protein BOX15_Mlig007124g1 [Macrostomum lignano]